MRNNRTWCGPCQRIAPTYHALAEEYSEQAIFVVRAAASQQRSTRVLLLRVDTKSPPCTAPHPVPSRASMLMSLASLLPSLECPACPRSCSSGGLWLPRESNSACSWQRDDQTHVSQLLCPGGPCAPPNNSCQITHAVAFSPSSRNRLPQRWRGHRFDARRRRARLAQHGRISGRCLMLLF
jgi:thiol-disulfide isomerase/thioredoxin